MILWYYFTNWGPCNFLQMEALRVKKVQERAEACLKSFCERTLTKKAARENLLYNDNFHFLIDEILETQNGRIRDMAQSFILKCVGREMVSLSALTAIILQKLKSGGKKRDTLPVLEAIVNFILELERNGHQISVSIAASEPKLIPFILDKLLLQTDIEDLEAEAVQTSSPAVQFFHFLLGDPEQIITTFILDEVHYKTSRNNLLSFLVNNASNCAIYCNLLIEYFYWNSYCQDQMELSYLTPLIKFEWTFESRDLFLVYLEVLCDSFVRFGTNSLVISKLISKNASFFDEELAFKISSVLFLRTSSFASSTALIHPILTILSNFPQLNNFSKVLCSYLGTFSGNFDTETNTLISKTLIQSVSKTESFSFTPRDSKIECFSEFGHIVSLGFEGKVGSSSSSSSCTRSCSSRSICKNENYFDFIEISHNLTSFSVQYFAIKRGHFEIVFSLLCQQWNSFTPKSSVKEQEVVIKRFLDLFSVIEDESIESKVFRYSLIVDFFESNFNSILFITFLPLISDHVVTTDNVLFSFIQDKISKLLLPLIDKPPVQLSLTISLFNLLKSSESRQSRLNFIASTALGYFNNILNKNIRTVDSRAVCLNFKICSRLSEIQVLDPRTIWTKYCGLDGLGLFSTTTTTKSDVTKSIIIAGIISFASAFKIISNHPTTNEIDPIKVKAIQFLISKLNDENTTELELDKVFSSLACFDVESLKTVELLRRNNKEEEEEDVGVERVEVDDSDLLQDSNIFNPSKLYKLSQKYKNNSANNLWGRLVDYEVDEMARTKFLGSGNVRSDSSSKNRVTVNINIGGSVKPIINPMFCNSLLCFDCEIVSELKDVSSVFKYFKDRVIPSIPAISSLVWYVRPHLFKFIRSYIASIISKIDDQRILKDMMDYEVGLNALKGSSSSPSAACSLILIISALQAVFYSTQRMSLKQVQSGWIIFLTQLEFKPEFKAFLNNDDFLSALSVSAAILSDCSDEVNAILSDLIDGPVLSKNQKDNTATYCGIEAMSVLNSDRITKLYENSSISVKRRLTAGLSLCRLGKLKIEDLSHLITSSAAEPLEFKGISVLLQKKDELLLKSQQRALEKSDSIPAALKFEAIFNFLIGKGLDLHLLSFTDAELLQTLASTTKDTKSLAFLQLLSAIGNVDSLHSSEIDLCNTSTGSSALERFDEKTSWLKTIAESDDFLYLNNCRLLPRIDWSFKTEQFNTSSTHLSFEFLLKHTLSITPVTKVPYLNVSLYKIFRDNLIKFIGCSESKRLNSDKIKKIIQILFNRHEDVEIILMEIFETIIVHCDEYSEDLLCCVLEECKGQLLEINMNNYLNKFTSIFDINEKSSLFKNQKVVDCLISFSKHFKLEWSDLLHLDSSIKTINRVKYYIENTNCTVVAADKWLDVLASRIRGEFKGKIDSVLEILDLFIIFEGSRDYELMLSNILENILGSNQIELESCRLVESITADQEARMRSRLSHEGISIRIVNSIENALTFKEYNKASF